MAVADQKFKKVSLFESLSRIERKKSDLRIIRFAIIDSTQQYQITEHIHCEYEIMIPLQGFYKAALNGENLKLKPGTLLFIQPGDRHEDQCEGRFRFAAMRFAILNSSSQDNMIPLITEHSVRLTRIYQIEKSSLLEHLLLKICGEPDARGIIRRASIENSIKEFCWTMLEGIPEHLVSDDFKSSLEGNSLLSELESIFSRHKAQNISVREIADKLGMSLRILEYKLKESGNPPPAQLFREYKVREAIHFMLYDGLNVNQAADALGFKNSFHFSRIFKSVTGIPPSEFKKRTT